MMDKPFVQLFEMLQKLWINIYMYITMCQDTIRYDFSFDKNNL